MNAVVHPFDEPSKAPDWCGATVIGSDREAFMMAAMESHRVEVRFLADLAGFDPDNPHDGAELELLSALIWGDFEASGMTKGSMAEWLDCHTDEQLEAML
ncbi:hypothetical protein [Halomonas stenophila]|uniref:Uncharacterized protein n=1 Tax=Halomonas stenophila TaxID=795312 RepID=A0A7W5ETC8_9GAMM|nr:hypothetical protein [Halomonas stenophila]MBB3231068.1 hypothetical protein [Halomonas stenophila]